MEKVTIKVRDGEVTIPPVGKIVKDGKVTHLLRLTKDHDIHYIFPETMMGGTCDLRAWRVEELKNVKPCSVDFWNNTLQGYALLQIRKITKFATENSLI